MGIKRQYRTDWRGLLKLSLGKTELQNVMNHYIHVPSTISTLRTRFPFMLARRLAETLLNQLVGSREWQRNRTRSIIVDDVPSAQCVLTSRAVRSATSTPRTQPPRAGRREARQQETCRNTSKPRYFV